jgi:hypothetical protein
MRGRALPAFAGHQRAGARGTDAMRCLRLSNKVLRWYTDCCRTPIANSPAGPRFPVIGVVHSFMDHEADSRSRDEVLGPPLCRIYERSAVGPLPPDAPGPPSLGVFARRASKMLGWWVRGLSRPTPFFDDRTKAPRRACSRGASAPLFDPLRHGPAAPQASPVATRSFETSTFFNRHPKGWRP